MKLISALAGRRFFAHLSAFQSVVILAFTFALCVTLPQQSVEWYRYLAQALARYRDFGQARGLQESITLVAAVTLLSLAFLVLLMFLRSLHLRGDTEGQTDPADTFPLMWIACTPLLAVGFGLLRATIDIGSPDLKNALFVGAKASFAKDGFVGPVADKLAHAYVDSQLGLNTWLYAGALALFALAALFWLSARWFAPRRVAWDSTKNAWLVFGLSAPLVISGFFLAFPGLPALLSPIGIICLFFASLGFFMSAISLFTARTGVPVLLLLIMASVAFSLLGLNDNHRMRELVLASPPTKATNSVAEGFQSWLAARKDRSRYDVYPVYVVAAEGGGIYAAYRTATFLTTLQDQCPRFAHHLFAISGVSGGSLGASIYGALMKQVRQDDKRFEAGSGCVTEAGSAKKLYLTDVAEQMLSEDYLSPVLAFFLFPDLVQKFLPFPVAYFDRSTALEKSLEKGWDEHTAFYRMHVPEAWTGSGNPLREPFSTLWDPTGDTPALFLNTTEVETGRGRALSPFTLDAAEFAASPAVPGNTSSDVALSTATVLSARFPWLTPPGWLRIPRVGKSGAPPNRKIHLVDGAYFDNSGIVTAVAIARELQRSLRESQPLAKVQVNLIVLTSGGFADPSFVVTDYLAPFQSILSTRSARAAMIIKQAGAAFMQELPGATPADPSEYFGKVELQGFGYPLPLGWRLSPITRLLILGESEGAGACGEDSGNTENKNCVRSKIYRDMMK
jgi:hypothetical protein